MLMIRLTAVACTTSALLAAPQETAAWKKPDRESVEKIVLDAVAKSRKDRSLPAIMFAAAIGKDVFLSGARGKVGKKREADATTLFPLGPSGTVPGLSPTRWMAS